MNSKMIDSFNEFYSHKSLSTELSCILDSGFVDNDIKVYLNLLLDSCFLLLILINL